MSLAWIRQAAGFPQPWSVLGDRPDSGNEDAPR
jgi:hypothetical protein